MTISLFLIVKTITLFSFIFCALRFKLQLRLLYRVHMYSFFISITLNSTVHHGALQHTIIVNNQTKTIKKKQTSMFRKRAVMWARRYSQIKVDLNEQSLYYLTTMLSATTIVTSKDQMRKNLKRYSIVSDSGLQHIFHPRDRLSLFSQFLFNITFAHLIPWWAAQCLTDCTTCWSDEHWNWRMEHLWKDDALLWWFQIMYQLIFWNLRRHGVGSLQPSICLFFQKCISSKSFKFHHQLGCLSS